MSQRRSASEAGILERRLRNLQSHIGVEGDGLIGPVTLTRLEDLLDEGRDVVSRSHSLEVSKTGLDQLMQFEISSERNYERRLAAPIWPGGESGVTIGVGYDLGFNTRATIRSDWGGRIPDAVLEELLTAAGRKGQAARAMIPGFSRIRVALQPAKEVFYSRTLPRFASETRRAYPGTESLPADAQAMMLSLVYNRGTKMDGPRRSEMAAIRPLVRRGDLPGIAAQIRSMKRLWDINELRGLHIRRDREAEMIEGARRTYPPGELVRV